MTSEVTNKMVRLCPLSQLARGGAMRLETRTPIAVFHTEEGELSAIDDTCTHQDASPAEGYAEGCEVECPLHSSEFGLRPGTVDAPPARLPVRVHAVEVRDGDIYLQESRLTATSELSHPKEPAA